MEKIHETRWFSRFFSWFFDSKPFILRSQKNAAPLLTHVRTGRTSKSRISSAKFEFPLPHDWLINEIRRFYLQNPGGIASAKTFWLWQTRLLALSGLLEAWNGLEGSMIHVHRPDDCGQVLRGTFWELWEALLAAQRWKVWLSGSQNRGCWSQNMPHALIFHQKKEVQQI